MKLSVKKTTFWGFSLKKEDYALKYCLFCNISQSKSKVKNSVKNNFTPVYSDSESENYFQCKLNSDSETENIITFY